jgi:UDP-3-O-[3-hydroxymyristoyl] glucosamine N-acyltransferase
MKPNAPDIRAAQINQICQHPTYSSLLKVIQTKDDASATRIAEPPIAAPNTLVFASTPEMLAQALKGQPSILVLLEKLTAQPIEFAGALFSTPSIPAAMALILPLFDRKKSRFHQGHHPKSIADSTAKIGENVSLGAYSVIGAHVQIGDGCLIGAHAVIEPGAIVGAGTILHPHTFVGAECRIGKNCEIHPQTSIGSDGFGYTQGPDQKRHKIPQLGIVVLEDNVEIGSACAIDRATIGETRIGEGTKVDNLCHIAHNCKIGKNNAITACFSIAGSSEIGDNCIFGGQAGVGDHIKVGSDMIFAARSGVTKDILKSGAYGGFPLEPMRDAVRTLANLPNLTSLRKQVAQIRKHLGMKDEAL